MLNALYKEGWRPKHIGIPTLAGIIGKAIALGLGVYNNYRKQLEDKGRQIDSLADFERADVTKYAMDVALRHANDELKDIEKGDYIWHNNAESYFQTVQDRIGGTIFKYIQADPIKPTSRIIAAEYNFGPEYGNAQADLILSEDGEKRILDYKTASQYRAQYHASDMEKYRDLFQVFHYAWSWQDMHHETISQYYICHLVTQGYRCELLPFYINPEALTLWHQTAREYWSIMGDIESGVRNPWMVAEHSDKWGKCEMYEACFKYRFDEQAMKARYTKVAKPDA